MIGAHQNTTNVVRPINIIQMFIFMLATSSGKRNASMWCLSLFADGDAVMVNMSSRASLSLYKFHSRVHAISFSPDGKSVNYFYSTLSLLGYITVVVSDSGLLLHKE